MAAPKVQWCNEKKKAGLIFRHRLLQVIGGTISDNRTFYEVHNMDLTHHKQLLLGGKLVANIQKLKWESNLFQKTCWNACFAIRSRTDQISVISRAMNQTGIIWARIASIHRHLISTLRKERFKPILEMVNLELPLTIKFIKTLRVEHAIRNASLKDATELGSLARKMFFFDRFHLDPCIPSHLANEAHVQWIKNSVRKKVADETLVAMDNGKIAGFHALKWADTPKGKVGITVLIGVAREFAGKGIGRSLLAAGLTLLWQKGARHAWVRTEAKNTAANSLYNSFGFQGKNRFWYLRKVNS